MKIKIDKKEIEPIMCVHFKQRFFGLMGKKNITAILCFPKCNSIHTFFMKEAIDVVMLDSKGIILYQYPSVQPWCLILPKKGVYYTIELPNGTLKKELHFHL